MQTIKPIKKINKILSTKNLVIATFILWSFIILGHACTKGNSENNSGTENNKINFKKGSESR